MSEAAEAETADLAPETGAETGKPAEHDVSDATTDDAEAEALAMGWKPQDQYKGPADKFVSAAEYVERGKTILPFLRNELKRRDREIEGLKKAVTDSVKHISRAEERAYKQAKADLEAELDQAAEAGDKASVKAVTDDLIALEKDRIEPAAKGDEPEWFVAWREDNAWWGKDKPLTAAAVQIANDAETEGYSDKALAKEVDRRLREQFPTKFAKPENPNRRLPGAVEGAGAGPKPRGKVFSDLPSDAQAMCDQFCRDIKGFTREKFLKDYDWSTT